MDIIFSLIFFTPAVLITFEFLYFLKEGKKLYNTSLRYFLEAFVLIVLPTLYLVFLDVDYNNCCGDTATFSPDHKLTIYVLIAISVLAYIYARFKTGLGSPFVEVLINSLLLIGFVLNIFVAIQIGEFYWLFANLPIGILFITQLAENHKSFLKNHQSPISDNKLEKLAWSILNQMPLLKFPILLILCVPILAVISSVLMIFCQKPDSVIHAFTDTYKHTFSQLDYECENVQCGDHFLCSVAANGHQKWVKPVRFGERHGAKIICNRQLLVSNAFEELIQERFPYLHKPIRKHYNKIGNLVHCHYHIFNNKYLSDFIYVLMKPLEFLFIVTLYTFDNKPENRIAKQYLQNSDRQRIDDFFNHQNFN